MFLLTLLEAGLESGKLTYVDTHAHVIEVLTGKPAIPIKPFCES